MKLLLVFGFALIASSSLAQAQVLEDVNQAISNAIERERESAVGMIERYIGQLKNQANRAIFEAMPESTIVWQQDVTYVSHPRVSYIKQDENSRCKAMIPKQNVDSFERPDYGCVSKFLSDDGAFMILGAPAQALLDSATKDQNSFFKNTVSMLLSNKEWNEILVDFDIKITQYVGGYDGGLGLNLLAKTDKYNYVSFKIMKCSENPHVVEMGGNEFELDNMGFTLGCQVPRASEVYRDIVRFKKDVASARKSLKKD